MHDPAWLRQARTAERVLAVSLLHVMWSQPLSFGELFAAQGTCIVAGDTPGHGSSADQIPQLLPLVALGGWM